MPVDPAIIARYERQLEVYRNRTAAILTAAWDGLTSYDRADIPVYKRSVAPQLAGAKAAAVALSAGFFSVSLGVRPRGVTPAEVDYEPNVESAFHATWHALKVGRPYAEAVAVGRSAAQAEGFNYVVSVSRRTGDVVAKKSGL